MQKIVIQLPDVIAFARKMGAASQKQNKIPRKELKKALSIRKQYFGE